MVWPVCHLTIPVAVTRLAATPARLHRLNSIDGLDGSHCSAEGTRTLQRALHLRWLLGVSVCFLPLQECYGGLDHVSHSRTTRRGLLAGSPLLFQGEQQVAHQRPHTHSHCVKPCCLPVGLNEIAQQLQRLVHNVKVFANISREMQNNAKT